jgi:hypothetical protein
MQKSAMVFPAIPGGNLGEYRPTREGLTEAVSLLLGCKRILAQAGERVPGTRRDGICGPGLQFHTQVSAVNDKHGSPKGQPATVDAVEDRS